MRARHLWFAVACVGLAALVALITSSGGSHEEESGSRSSATMARAGEDSGLERARAEAEVARALRRFMAAFLAYEVGSLKRSIEIELRATTTGRFYEELVGQPVRLPLGGPRPRVAELVEPLSIRLSPSGRRAVALAILRRAGAEQPSGFRLARRGGSWLVSGPAG